MLKHNFKDNFKNEEKDITPILPPELRLVLLCLDAGGENQEPVWELIKGGPDWKLFISLVIHHRVHPVVYRYLQSLEQDIVPREVLNTLRQVYRRNSVNLVNQTGEMLRVINGLESEGLKVLILKGAPLALRLYGEISLRPSRDIDILVDPSELDRAGRILENAGYSLKAPLPVLTPRQERAHRKLYHHREYYQAEKDIYLELHWQTHRSYSQKHELDDFATMELEIAGCRVPVLADEDCLFYLCLHGSRHRWFRLRWLQDIYRFFLTGRVNWNKIKAVADKSQLTILHQAMILIAVFFNSAVPESIHAELLADKKAVKLARTVINELAACRYNISEIAYRPGFRQKIGYNLKLRSGVMDKMDYIFNLFKPINEDFQVVALPDCLYPLYYLIRPVTWLGRRMGIPGSR